MAEPWETQADFKNGGQSLDGTSVDRRPDAIAFDYLTAFTYGPINSGDTSGGPLAHVWRVRDDGQGTVFLARENDARTDWNPETVLFTYTGAPILELDVAFEQLARPVVCAERATGVGGASEVWLYWFNPSTSQFEFTKFDSGRTPRVLLDYPPDTSISDVLLFYINDATGIVYRQQRDTYSIRYTTPIGADAHRFIEDVVFLTDWRVAVLFSEQQLDGSYVISRLESARYPVPLDIDKATISTRFTSATLVNVVINVSATGPAAFVTPEAITLALGFLSATLDQFVISETLADLDQLQVALGFASATLVNVVISEILVDIDQMTLATNFVSATLIDIVLEDTLFDVDALETSLAFSSATLQ